MVPGQQVWGNRFRGQPGQPAPATRAVLSARSCGQSDREQQRTGLGTGCQLGQLRCCYAYAVSNCRIVPTGTLQASQLQPRRRGWHLDPSQGPHVLIGNLDQTTRGVRTDPTQRPPVSPMQQSLSHLSRDTGNSSHVIDGKRATRHQIAQLSSERARIHPLLGTSIAAGRRGHAIVPFVEAFYL
jgi:hypothetical protein